MKEDYMVVLDYLPLGKPNDPRGTPIVQGVGTRYFALLEATPKPGAKILPLETVFIGKEGRDKISVIKGRIHYEDLTSIAKDNLPRAIRKIIEENKETFLNFFNRTGPITIRLHSLELLPGIGKKQLIKILDEREKEPFKSFQDLKERTKLLGDPIDMIVNRIIQEIRGDCKYYLFARPPVRGR
jgi:putative nucleotide binding protein